MPEQKLNQLAQSLRTNPIFAGLDGAGAMAVLRMGGIRSHKEGALLFAEGDPCDGLYVVMEGRFGVMGSQDGEPVPLALIPAGGCIGEMSLVSARPRSATVQALSDATVWHLGGSVFEAMLTQGDPRAAALLTGMQVQVCQRFREALVVNAQLAARATQSEDGQLLVESLGWEV